MFLFYCRIDWLQQGSREVFGTILEEQVYILIDTSQSMKDKLSMVKEKLFQLMQVNGPFHGLHYVLGNLNIFICFNIAYFYHATAHFLL